MDRSRTPRNLSDEARFLQRLAEPELPPGTTDAERAAAAAEVEAAVGELGGEWAHAYQELRPDWQPPPTDIEITAEQAAVTRFLQIFEDIRRDHTFYHDDHGASIPLEPLYTHILATMNLMTQAEAFAAPGAIGALWVGPPTPDGVPTEQERNARMWLPRFAPPQQTCPRCGESADGDGAIFDHPACRDGRCLRCSRPQQTPPPFAGQGHRLGE